MVAQSLNPLLKNLTDFLIEEASAEEEELLGISNGIVSYFRNYFKVVYCLCQRYVVGAIRILKNMLGNAKLFLCCREYAQKKIAAIFDKTVKV